MKKLFLHPILYCILLFKLIVILPRFLEATDDDNTQMYEGEGQGSQDGGTTAERDDMYSGLSDGEIEEPDAYSDISSDENFLDSLNDDQRMVRGMHS